MSAPLDPPPGIDPAAFLSGGPLVPFVMALTDARFLWVGPQAERVLGYPREQWTEDGFWAGIVEPQDQVLARDARSGVAASGADLFVDYRVRAPDGSTRWVTEAGVVVTRGGEQRVHGYLIDVTERKLREVHLWRNEEHLRALLRNAPDAMILTDLEGRIVNMNAQAEGLFQYRQAEVTGSSIDPLVPERLQGRLAELRGRFEEEPARRTLVDGQTFAVEQRDGTEVPVEIGMSLITEGDQPLVLNTFRDLTARRRVEAQLRSSERRVHQIANVLPAMIAIVGTDLRLRFANDAYADWHGWQRHQLEGRALRELVGERLFARIEPAVRAAFHGTAAHFRGELRGAEGSAVPVDISLAPQFDEELAIDGALLVMFDISDEVAARVAERKHRDELAHVARVATLGELAASIAHELNQPLSAVVANANAARRYLERTPPERTGAVDALDDVAADARRAGEVISSMRELLQRRSARTERADIRDLVAGAVDLLHSEAVARGVDLVWSADAHSGCAVRGDGAQLKQVFLNLIKNGIESTAGTESPRTVTATIGPGAHGRCRVAIADDGPGFGAHDPEHLFQPFVTHREGGLGMGLSISRSITEAHGGTLTAAPREESGAVFVVELPCVP